MRCEEMRLCTGSVRDGWRHQNRWIFGKVPNGLRLLLLIFWTRQGTFFQYFKSLVMLRSIVWKMLLTKWQIQEILTFFLFLTKDTTEQVQFKVYEPQFLERWMWRWKQRIWGDFWPSKFCHYPPRPVPLPEVSFHYPSPFHSEVKNHYSSDPTLPCPTLYKTFGLKHYFVFLKKTPATGQITFWPTPLKIEISKYFYHRHVGCLSRGIEGNCSKITFFPILH